MSDPAYPPTEPPPKYDAPNVPQSNYPPPEYGKPTQPVQPYPIQSTSATMPPPAPGQPYYPAPGQTTVITAPMTTVVHQIKFGEAPVVMTCPHCQSHVTTSTSYKIGTFTWMVVGLIALIGLLFFPPLWFCCCIPCCIPSCKDVQHHCPNCSKYVGHYGRMM